MKLKVYSIYDSKVGAYMRPFFAQARGMAVREFGDIVQDKSHPIGKHPEDYSLFELGEWNDQNGDMLPNAARECVCHAQDFLVGSEPDLVDQAAAPATAALISRAQLNGGDL